MAGVTVRASITAPTATLPTAAGNVVSQDAILSVRSAADDTKTSALTLTNLPGTYVNPLKAGFVDITAAAIATYMTAYNAATGNDWVVYEGIYVTS